MASEFTLASSVIAGFIQFAADNEDHNTYSLDEREIFHGMRIIMCSREEKMMTNKRIKMFSKVIKSSDAVKRVELKLLLVQVYSNETFYLQAFTFFFRNWCGYIVEKHNCYVASDLP